MKTNFEKVKEFHVAFGVEGQTGEEPSLDLIDLRLRLIGEEVAELHKEFRYVGGHEEDFSLKNYDVKNVAKELADILYVVYGTAASFNIPIDEVFDRVHKSNMSKLSKDGTVLRREDGKVMKSEHYQPPNLDFLNKE